MNYSTLQKAIGHIQSNERVFIHSAAMTPQLLVDELAQQYQRLSHVEILGIHTEGQATYTQWPYCESFHLNALFVGHNVRNAVQSGIGTYTPIFLSDIHRLFEKELPIDVAMIQVSPPDQHGFCYMGASLDITYAAIHKAKKIIALVNNQVPRVHGDGMVHESKITVAVKHDAPIFTINLPVATAVEQKIGYHIAELIEDGATLQMGIGAIPDVVLHNLKNHQRLGIHTEMFSDGILPLVESGVITGEEKVIKKNKIVTCFALGSQKLYDFMHDNPMVNMKEASYTNHVGIIMQNPKVTAINSAIEIDLTGQVCADTIGSLQYSGVGGQMDFIRGAALSVGGKPIIALSARTRKGKNKLVARLTPGAGVTTTRAHVHYVVTEYGVVNLFGKSLKDRAKLLISIAHPQDREQLTKEAYEFLNLNL